MYRIITLGQKETCLLLVYFWWHVIGQLNVILFQPAGCIYARRSLPFLSFSTSLDMSVSNPDQRYLHAERLHFPSA